MQPLTVQVYRERIVAWQYLVVYDVFTVTPTTDHNIKRVKTCIWLRLLLLILVNPRWTALDVDVQTPLLIHCEDRLHPILYTSVRVQFSSHLGTSLEIAFRQITITHCDNFYTFPN
ncbi:hypothetical protein Y032_0011g1342 [Ancylostoma ceylanicum]|uniref:Uncharacterized protein n=1 Tax=Ancylostoma ceylanicum TaxID=53326 RepID=A0A016VF99_9BILA|nr:hypothetical protein Y032_0011g1342 [Ancylostoma ceylanicum]